MKRLALVLAAAVLGSGCIWMTDDMCDRTVTLEWDFRTADGAVVSCSSATAAIDTVEVWIDSRFAGAFSCFDGRGSVSVGSGSHLVTVEAYEGASRVYRDEFTASATCGNQIFATRPAEGRVNLDYAVASTPAVCGTGPCFLWFSVWDDIAQEPAAVVNASTVPTLYPFPNDLIFRLPAGPYTVQWMQLVSGGVEQRRACFSPGFSVAPGQSAGEEQFVPAAPVQLQATCG